MYTMFTQTHTHIRVICTQLLRAVCLCVILYIHKAQALDCPRNNIMKNHAGHTINAI